jgi:hypothetical protein
MLLINGGCFRHQMRNVENLLDDTGKSCYLKKIIITTVYKYIFVSCTPIVDCVAKSGIGLSPHFFNFLM